MIGERESKEHQDAIQTLKDRKEGERHMLKKIRKEKKKREERQDW